MGLDRCTRDVSRRRRATTFSFRSSVGCAREGQRGGFRYERDDILLTLSSLFLSLSLFIQAETEAIIKVADPNSKYTSAQTFDELGLSAELLQGLYTEMKFEKPSKIQAETLPMILTPPHRNLIAQAHNGSGKTTCFTLGILSRVNVNEPGTQGLMICPTRELVIQNVGVMQRMGKYTNISIASTADPKYDGYNKEQINGQVVIGTPGRLLRWMREKQLDCSKVNCLVFDEADNMLGTDGHRVDSTKIL